MTVFYAYDQTDLLSVNFNYWYGVYNDGDELLQGDVDYDTAEFPFDWSYTLYTTAGDALSFYGSDFVDDTPFVTQGTIQAARQWAWDGVDTWVERWYWEGWTLDMEAFYNAGQTVFTADDRAILAAVLDDNDEMYLSTSDDEMRGFKGADYMFGDGGDDTLYGNIGRDRIEGGNGDDEIYGGTGADNLSGDAGNDIINGNGGYDTLNGGSGFDLLFGGRQGDTFEFNMGDDKEVIMDFVIGQDVIDLTSLRESHGLDMLTWQEFKSLYTERSGVNNEHTQVVLDDGQKIIIRDVHRWELDGDDFLF